MTVYQTTIQKPGAIRFGSAKIEVKDDNNAWVDLGAVKSLTATMNVKEAQKFEPDNALYIEYDPEPESWDFKFDLQEVWDADVLELLRGDIDTSTSGTSKTTIGIYAGTGSRPYRSVRITNTTAGESPVILILASCKCISELDVTFGKDGDRTTANALPVTLRAYPQNVGGFGTLEIPDSATTHTITPATVSVAVGSTEELTISGSPTTVTYGVLDSSIATVSAGTVTGVAVGSTVVIVTIDGVVHQVPVTVTSE